MIKLHWKRVISVQGYQSVAFLGLSTRNCEGIPIYIYKMRFADERVKKISVVVPLTAQ